MHYKRSLIEFDILETRIGGAFKILCFGAKWLLLWNRNINALLIPCIFKNLRDFEFESLPYHLPMYSPDLTLSDYNLFVHLNRMLHRKSFLYQMMGSLRKLTTLTKPSMKTALK